jgi:plastocyanin
VRRLRNPILTAGLVAAGVLLAACDQGGNDPASQAPVSGDQVAVVDNDFEPANLEISAGDTVTWAWEGRSAHDVVGDGFDSGVLTEGTFTHTFDEPGTYEYECTLHAGMTGQVTVVDP